MKNCRTICSEVASEVRDMMQRAIMDGYDSVYYEKEYGTALVVVEVYQRKVSGWWQTFTDVIVSHESAWHTSPLLTKAIQAILPSWDTMEKEVNGRMSFQ